MRELGEVPEEARELAMSRFRLIQPHLEKGTGAVNLPVTPFFSEF